MPWQPICILINQIRKVCLPGGVFINVNQITLIKDLLNFLQEHTSKIVAGVFARLC